MYVQELDLKTDISVRTKYDDILHIRKKKKLLADLSDYTISVSVMKYQTEFASVK